MDISLKRWTIRPLEDSPPPRHVNGVAAMDSHYLVVFARRIPTVRGYCSRFQTKSSMAAAANRKYFFGLVSHVSDVILR